MRYKEFFEIKLVHPYTKGILEYLVLTADKSAIPVIKKNRFLLKNTVSGFKILMPVDEQGKSLVVLGVDDTLVFNVFPSSQAFFEFTDFSAINENKIFLFTNQGLGNDSVDLLLSETSINDKLNSFPAVGQIKITPNNVTPVIDNVAPVYEVRFEAKSMTWKYFFITKEESDSLSVESKDITFKKLNEETLDPVFKGLKANFITTEMNIQAFESEVPLVCQNIPRKDIQLKNDRVTVIKHLPNPDIGDHGIQIIKIN